MPYRNKTYVCFDADTDMKYYNIMRAWKQNDNIDFNFFNAHDLNDVNPWDGEPTIKRKLKERLQNTKLFIVLVGEKTKYLYKYVRWEIDFAIELDLPIIVANLNKKRQFDDDLCPAILDNQLAIHVGFYQAIITYAMDNWPDWHAQYKKEGKTGAFYYKSSVYEDLGL